MKSKQRGFNRLGRPLSVFSLLGIVSGCGGASPISSDQEILGGASVPAGKFPGVGALSPGGCTATLLNANTIITANHCVEQSGGAENMDFTYTKRDGSTATLKVKPQVEPEILSTSPVRELAILRLAGPATDVSFATLPAEELNPGAIATIVGYGNDGSEKALNRKKLSGKVKIANVGMVKIGEELGTMIRVVAVPVAERKEGEKANLPCDGDSGGPLLVGSKIVGVLSFGEPTDPNDIDFNFRAPADRCRKTGAAYYVSVSANLEWIRDARLRLDTAK
jgi:trypsin